MDDRERQLLLFDGLRPPGRPVPPSLPRRPGTEDLPDLPALFSELNDRLFGGLLDGRVEWSGRLTVTAGTCDSDLRLLRLSIPYHRRSPHLVPITLAHEMCHLIVPDHGPAFRRLGRMIARALGVDWRTFRYAERWADAIRYRYVYRCPSCGAETPSNKRLRASCGQCGPRTYDEARRLTLAESRARPGPVLLGQRPVQGE